MALTKERERRGVMERCYFVHALHGADSAGWDRRGIHSDETRTQSAHNSHKFSTNATAPSKYFFSSSALLSDARIMCQFDITIYKACHCLTSRTAVCGLAKSPTEIHNCINVPTRWLYSYSSETLPETIKKIALLEEQLRCKTVGKEAVPEKLVADLKRWKAIRDALEDEKKGVEEAFKDSVQLVDDTCEHCAEKTNSRHQQSHDRTTAISGPDHRVNLELQDILLKTVDTVNCQKRSIYSPILGHAYEYRVVELAHLAQPDHFKRLVQRGLISFRLSEDNQRRLSMVKEVPEELVNFSPPYNYDLEQVGVCVKVV